MAPGQIGDYYYSRAATIYGGSNEIQRNIIARWCWAFEPSWRSC